MTTTGRFGKPIEILMVEDNAGDIRLMLEALKESKVVHRLSVVEDGVSALEFLRRGKGYEDAPRPDLILLDLNLPRKDGREVLETIKSDRELQVVPVIVFTSSKSEDDIVRAYRAHANCYINKPVDLDRFIAVVKSIEVFWMNTVRLPPK